MSLPLRNHFHINTALDCASDKHPAQAPMRELCNQSAVTAEEVILRARRQFVRRSTAGGFKIAVLDQCLVVQSPAEIHTELNRRFPKIRLDIVRGGLSNTALIQ